MDVYLTDLQNPSEQATNQGEQATNPGGRVTGLAGRGKVSRVWGVVMFVLAKIFTGVDPAFQRGLWASGGRRKDTIERTVLSRAYGRWAMFDQTFIGAGSRPGGSHGGGHEQQVQGDSRGSDHELRAVSPRGFLLSKKMMSRKMSDEGPKRQESDQATKPSQARRKIQAMIEITQNQTGGRRMSPGLRTTT